MPLDESSLELVFTEIISLTFMLIQLSILSKYITKLRATYHTIPSRPPQTQQSAQN